MSNERINRLKQILEENVESESLAEIDGLLSNVPEITARDSHKRQVISLMMQELPRKKTRLQHILEWYPLALLLSQTRVIQRELWAASAVILLIGVIVTLTAPDPDLLSFSVIAPVVAAASVAMLYDDTVRAMLEIEETTRASARLLLLARLTLVFGFNLVLALTGSVALSLLDNETLLLPLIMSWLAPMTFLAGFAFFLSIVARDTLFAAGASLILWIGHLILSQANLTNFWLQLLSMPGLSDPANRPNLLIGGVLLTTVALWLAGIVDRRAGYIS